MPKAYPGGFCLSVVRYVEQGHSRCHVAGVFGISPSFGLILMRQYRCIGCVKSNARGGARRDGLSRI